MNEIDYRTGGGGSMLRTTSPGVAVAGGESIVPGMPDLSRYAESIMARRDAETAAAAQERDAEREDKRRAMALLAQRVSGGGGGGPAPAPAAAEPQHFVKMLNGTLGQGYVPAQAWEPGARAAGPGAGAPVPGSATMHDSGAPSDASLDSRLAAPVPPKKKPEDVAGLNPYATGPGVISGTGRYM